MIARLVVVFSLSSRILTSHSCSLIYFSRSDGMCVVVSYVTVVEPAVFLLDWWSRSARRGGRRRMYC